MKKGLKIYIEKEIYANLGEGMIRGEIILNNSQESKYIFKTEHGELIPIYSTGKNRVYFADGVLTKKFR